MKLKFAIYLFCIASILTGCSRQSVSIVVQPKTVKVVHPRQPHPWEVGYPFTLFVYRLDEKEYLSIQSAMATALTYSEQAKLGATLFQLTRTSPKPLHEVLINSSSTTLSIERGHYLVYGFPSSYNKHDSGWATWGIGKQTAQVSAMDWLFQSDHGDP
jgi:hypothetical protein